MTTAIPVSSHPRALNIFYTTYCTPQDPYYDEDHPPQAADAGTQSQSLSESTANADIAGTNAQDYPGDDDARTEDPQAQYLSESTRGANADIAIARTPSHTGDDGVSTDDSQTQHHSASLAGIGGTHAQHYAGEDGVRTDTPPHPSRVPPMRRDTVDDLEKQAQAHIYSNVWGGSAQESHERGAPQRHSGDVQRGQAEGHIDLVPMLSKNNITNSTVHIHCRCVAVGPLLVCILY